MIILLFLTSGFPSASGEHLQYLRHWFLNFKALILYCQPTSAQESWSLFHFTTAYRGLRDKNFPVVHLRKKNYKTQTRPRIVHLRRIFDFVFDLSLNYHSNTSIKLPHILSLPVFLSPAEDSTQQRSIETLRRRQASLHLPNRHLVFGGGAEQRQTTRDRTENLSWVGHSSHTEAVLTDGQGWQGWAVQLGRDGNWI